jgi:branched-chain amino acid transport system substrate-binding protein
MGQFSSFFKVKEKDETMGKKLGKSVGLIIIVGLLAAGSSFGAEPIKVGIVWPLTGTIAAAGSYLVAGAKIGAERINAQGGILGRRLELLIEDGANDPAQSVSAAERLVTREKIDLFMGAWGSSPTLAVSSSVTKKYGIPHVAETASSVKLTNQDGKRPNPWLFRTSPNSEIDAENLVPLFPKMGFSKVAILPVNTDWGRGAAIIFPEMMKKNGITHVMSEFINQDTTEFLTQLTKIKNSDADAIFLVTDQAQTALILKQYKALGLKQKVLASPGSTPEGLVELAGQEAVEGVYMVAYFARWFPELTPVPQEAKWFIDEYLKRGNPVKGFGECFRGYDGLKAIKAALEIAKTTDKEKVREAFAKVDTLGLTGRIKFDEFGQSRPNIYVVQVKDGKPYMPDFYKK